MNLGPELLKLSAEHKWLKRVASKLRNETPNHMKVLLGKLSGWHLFHVPNSLPIAIALHKPSRTAIVSEYNDFHRYKAAGFHPMRLSMYQWNNPDYALRIIQVHVANALRKG